MDGSCSLVWYLRGGRRMSVNIFFDIPFWGAWNDHFWLWAANCFKCLVSALRESRIAKQLLTILRQMPQLKDSPAASRMRFVLSPPRQFGPWSYPRYSSDFACSQGKTLLFPLLRQFLDLQLSCQMSFCTKKKFLLTTLQNFFLKLWMLLLFLSLASVIWVACWLRSCQPTSSALPSSGCAKVASSPSSSTSMTAPTTAPLLSCARDPTPVKGCHTFNTPAPLLQELGLNNNYTSQ